ncbi:MAG TPA: hypothetical protein VHD33_02950, partial [Legionellaceae bacterium]|nr:hypothetical protein [Legionellaceae bacterium]
METKPTGMLVALVFASQATDSTGESIDIKNLNTDIFDQGLGVVNYEHKSYKDSNGEEVVGKILYCKKIFNEKDCDNELQEKAWEEIQMPFLWGIIRLWDKAGHPGAISLAASIRDQANNKEKIILRASIEGNTVSRDGNKLTECIARRVTLTFSPANRTCDATLVADPNAPDGFEKNPIPSKEFPELEDALKFENPEFSRLGSSDHKMSIIDESQLNKALSAGVGNVAPSELAGGAVLASEHFVSRRPLKERVKDLLSREWKDKYDKDEVRKLIKFMLPEVSDSYLNHFEDAVEDLHLRRSGLKKSDNHLIRLHRLEIALRKSIDDLKVTSLTDAHLPCLYVLFYKADGKE